MGSPDLAMEYAVKLREMCDKEGYSTRIESNDAGFVFLFIENAKEGERVHVVFDGFDGRDFILYPPPFDSLNDYTPARFYGAEDTSEAFEEIWLILGSVKEG